MSAPILRRVPVAQVWCCKCQQATRHTCFGLEWRCDNCDSRALSGFPLSHAITTTPESER